jgi:2-dehydro-3-deoxy-D-arabinonate dehydratase
LHRPLDSLLDYLGRCKKFAFGALLFTGTGVVPPDNFTLQAEDEVQITIDPIGRLTNPVKVVGI